MTEEFKHYPVMLHEAVDALDCKPGLLYIDATLGGGGYSCEIAKRIQPDGKLFAFDVDRNAIEVASERLAEFGDSVTIFKANYSEIPKILEERGIEKITGGIVFDLGASYYQLTSGERGFSFSHESKLDMRFDMDGEKTAYDVVNFYHEADLVRIFQEYGEERYSRRIASRIVKKRQEKKIETTKELADLICSAVPRNPRNKIHPATRVFQAIRIEVNDELNNLENTLNGVISLLDKSARIAVVSFHSLEDKIVKRVFKYLSSDCNCGPYDLICSCPPRKLDIITKKPIIASEGEIKQNPPSRSAKLRVAGRV